MILDYIYHSGFAIEAEGKAIDNVPSKRTEPWLIFVANGTYEEQIIIPEDKPYIMLRQRRRYRQKHLKYNRSFVY